MNLPGVLLWGFAATIVLTTTMAIGQGVGYTRMSMPFLVGTMFTPARDRAMVIGFCVHVANGMIFALFYAVLPTVNRVLQPPGFLALNYGRRTPFVTIVAHLLYGAIIGAFYHLAS